MNGAKIATSILSLIAGIGVFLIACNIMSDGLEALGSKKLKALFAKTSKSKLLGVGIGTAATVAIQSSSATTVMVIGFVNAGIMTLTQAATIIFGANIGTTVTGQLVALGMFGNSISTSAIFAAFAGIGAFITVFAKKDAVKKTGGILAGFGMLFVGLSVMSDSMSFFSEMESLRLTLSKFKNPILLALMGMLLTAVIQSSSVMTSMAITMVVTGLITLNQGVYITMGSNVGTCITALLASISGTKNAKRAAIIHLIFNISGVILFMLIGWFLTLGKIDYEYIFKKMFPHAPQLQLSMFHTIFNLLTVIIVLPLTNLLVKLVTKIIPNKKDETAEDGKPHLKYAEEHMLKTFPIAVGQIKKEIIDMAEISIENFDIACEMICNLNFGDIEKFEKNEERLDFLNSELPRFMTKLLQSALGDYDRIYISTAFRSVIDLERIGDYAVNIKEYAERLHREKEKFSDKAVEEIKKVNKYIRNLYIKVMNAYEKGDLNSLNEAEIIEVEIDSLTDEMTENHIRRLNEGECKAEISTQYLSFANNAERVADHYMNIAKTLRAFHKLK